MARIVKHADVRKQELIDIALKQFMERGYTQTSIRSILKEACGEIGMFYHYFKSKNEVYEAALEKYNDNYILKVNEIIKNPILTFEEKLNQIFLGLYGSISEYSLLCSKKTNPEIMTILLSKTLIKMVPLFEQLISDGVEKGIIKKPAANSHLLSSFLLFGTSAIVHDLEVKSMEEKISNIKVLLNKILDVQVRGK